jgi:hypothetical protein
MSNDDIKSDYMLNYLAKLEEMLTNKQAERPEYFVAPLSELKAFARASGISVEEYQRRMSSIDNSFSFVKVDDEE